MGFLSFTVETYERRITKENSHINDNGNDNQQPMINDSCRYLSNHPKFGTHIRILRSENHNSLPNVVGSWLPRRDGDDDSKAYYYASMLAFLKPWRDLLFLKNDSESWEDAFNSYMENTTQRDRDVVAGCQYYYDSRSAMKASHMDMEEENTYNNTSYLDENDHKEVEGEDQSLAESVSNTIFFWDG
jgi:hypothetical protein